MNPHTEQEWTIHAVNIHGVFFERWCAHIVRSLPGWRVRSTNYPVKLPPDAGTPGQESSVDIIAQRAIDDRLLTLVIECKKNNPEFVNWVLFRRHESRNIALPVVTYAAFGSAQPVWQLARRLFVPHVALVDEARETRGNYTRYQDNKSKTKTANNAVSDAAYQVALGAQALAWEEHQRASFLETPPRHEVPWRDQVLVPVIATTANLFLVEFDAGAVDSQTGEIALEQVRLQAMPYLIFEYALPRHLHIGDVRMERFSTDESLENWSRLHILIVNSGHFSSFFNSDLLRHMAGLPPAA